ncbi:hypothetical protein M3Y99_00977200 [Aphelenchoides fujianensis]|nr:hypothetical protein M3Y99_00977200 [Aphelenchoides fujianensis]
MNDHHISFSSTMTICSRTYKKQLIEGDSLDRLGFLRHILGKTFLLSFCEPNQSAWGKALRIMRAVALMLIVLYQMSFVAYFVINRRGENIERSLVLLNWLLQSFISMCFIVYWQRHGHFHRLAAVVPWQNVALSDNSRFKHRVCKAFLVFWAFFCTCVVSLFFSAAVEYFLDAVPHYDPGLMDCWGLKQLRFISYIVTFYAFMCWLTVMSLYTTVSIVVHQELDTFNESLKEIGEDKTREEVSEQLLERYAKHTELGDMVRAVDNTFEGQIYPTTVFTLLAFYRSFNAQWYDIALSVPELLFCICQIIRQVESIIYGNLKIWQPFDDKVYQIANVFISHANQPTSLTLTYLTLLIQMNGPPSGPASLSALLNSTRNY